MAADGDIERIALDPKLQVTVVGKDPGARKGKGKSGSKKAKGKAKAKAKSLEAAAASETLAASPETKPSKTSRGRQKANVEKKMSCLDAAAKLLTETDQPMTCQELIETIAAKGYWTSPAGKTPEATLYAAIVREIRTKKHQARFRKNGPGRFARV
jgi:hypothetical protein